MGRQKPDIERRTDVADFSDRDRCLASFREMQPEGQGLRLDFYPRDVDHRAPFLLYRPQQERRAIRIDTQMAGWQRFRPPVAIGGIEHQDLGTRPASFPEHLDQVKAGIGPARYRDRDPMWPPEAGERDADNGNVPVVMKDDRARHEDMARISRVRRLAEVAPGEIRRGAVNADGVDVGGMQCLDPEPANRGGGQGERDIVFFRTRAWRAEVLDLHGQLLRASRHGKQRQAQGRDQARCAHARPRERERGGNPFPPPRARAYLVLGGTIAVPASVVRSCCRVGIMLLFRWNITHSEPVSVITTSTSVNISDSMFQPPSDLAFMCRK
ncbi:hypothetical protein D9M72_487850 [compost metagenome]